MLATAALWAFLLDPSSAVHRAIDVRQQYDAAYKTVGRDATAHIELALWCERHGMATESMEHLVQARLIEPKERRSAGLIGLVQARDGFSRPGDVTDISQRDGLLAAKLAAYRARRSQADESARSQWNLAQWCERNGLKDEAEAHLSLVVALDPGHTAAHLRLGHEKFAGQWMTRDEAAAARSESEAFRRADPTWRARLRLWKVRLLDNKTRDQAERELASVSDPLAAAAVWRVFVMEHAPNHARAAQLLGQIESIAASRGLALLSVFGSSPDARRVAGETLLSRDLHSYLDTLIELVQTPLKYEIRAAEQPGSVALLFVEGERFNLRRHYVPPPAFRLEPSFFGYAGLSDNGLPVVIRGRELLQMRLQPDEMNASLVRLAEERTAEMFADAQAIAVEQLKQDVFGVEIVNELAHRSNRSVLGALHNLTGQDLGEDHERWTKWAFDRKGYTYQNGEKPTYEQEALLMGGGYTPSVYSCFAAGTPVHSRDGLRPIERLEVGDQVLSQATTTGELKYEPVTMVHRNPLAATLRVSFADGDSLTATPVHRFWKAGTGWTMARDLRPGDRVRIVGGTARVESVSADAEQHVYNLDVRGCRTFFVGEKGALVHDNSEPSEIARPFDRVAQFVGAPK